MFKVVCIDASGMLDPDMYPLTEGDTYTVLREKNAPNGRPHYALQELPVAKDGYPAYYCKSHFIPISQIDETQFERNYKKELV